MSRWRRGSRQGQRRRLLLIGPLPPPIGGATAAFQHLIAEMQEEASIDVQVLDTLGGSESGQLARARMQLALLHKLVVGVAWADVISLHASARRAVVLGAALRVLSRMLGKRLLVRVFGGGLDQFLENRARFFSKLTDIMFSADVVLLETRHLVGHFTERYPRANIRWFPNSRPLGESPPRTRSSRSCNLRFLYVGQLRQDKGVLDLIRAVELCRDSLPELEVDIFGPVSAGFDQTLLRDRDGVSYCGVVSPSEVQNVLAQGYCALVLPTFYPGEGYPGVIVEAFAAGLPVIATRWRAIPEIVKPDANGILVPPGNALELAKALCRMFTEAGLRRSLGLGAREAAAEFDGAIWSAAFLEYCFGPDSCTS